MLNFPHIPLGLLMSTGKFASIYFSVLQTFLWYTEIDQESDVYKIREENDSRSSLAFDLSKRQNIFQKPSGQFGMQKSKGSKQWCISSTTWKSREDPNGKGGSTHLPQKAFPIEEETVPHQLVSNIPQFQWTPLDPGPHPLNNLKVQLDSILVFITVCLL